MSEDIRLISAYALQKKPNKFTELVYGESLGVFTVTFVLHFLQCSFDSAWCWKTVIDLRGLKIVLVHFVGTCLLAMNNTSFFQVIWY